MLRAFHIAIIYLYFSSVSFAQQVPDSAWNAGKEIYSLLNTWKEYREILNKEQYGSSVGSINSLFTLQYDNNRGYHLQNQVNEIKADMYHNDPGVDANVSYIHNFSRGVVIDEDNLIYQSRVQAGITWNVLGDGIISNRYHEKAVRNEILINQYLAESDLQESSYASSWNLIIYIFNKEKIALLKKRKELTEQLAISAEKLHLTKYLTREDYLKILSRKAEIEALLNIYEDYNAQFVISSDSILPDVNSLPLLDVNYGLVFAQSGMSSRDSITRLYLQNLQLKNHVVHDMRLSAGVRYNYYNLDPGNRSFLSMNISAGLPLPFQLKQREKLSEAEARYAMFQLDQKFEGKQKELLNECYEYRYKLKQFVGFYQKYQLYLELERKMNASLQLDVMRFNPVEGMLILDDMLSIRTELLDLRQSLYLKLLRIYTKSGLDKPEEVSQVFEMPNYFNLDDQIEKSVYCWSGIFTKKSTSFLSEYIIFNKIDNLVIGLNKNDTIRNKIKELVNTLRSAGIRFEAMTGNNQWIEGGVEKKLEELLQGFDPGIFQAVHLDVEPHTFADWNENKNEYLKKYLIMLSEAKSFCDKNNMELCVSVPLHYPEDVLNKIFTICNRVYFMAYENIRPEYITKKIAPFKNFRDKIVIALRTKDFTGRLSLEKLMIELFHKESLIQVAIHDLAGMISMDEKSIDE